MKLLDILKNKNGPVYLKTNTDGFEPWQIKRFKKVNLIKINFYNDYGVEYYCNIIDELGNTISKYFLKNFTGFQPIKDKDKEKVRAIFDDLSYSNLHNLLNNTIITGTEHFLFYEDKNGKVIPASSIEKESYAEISGMRTKILPNRRNCLQEHHNQLADSLAYKLCRVQNDVTGFPKAKLSSKTTMPLLSINGKVSSSFKINLKCKNVYGLVPNKKIDFQPAASHYIFESKFDSSKVTKIVKTLDAIIGVACVSLFAGLEDPKRRQAIPPGNYNYSSSTSSLTWMTLSNVWICHPFIYYLVADLSRKAFSLAVNDFENFWSASEKETIDTIINTDVKQAQVILHRNKELFVKLIKAAYPWTHSKLSGSVKLSNSISKKRTDDIFNIFINGIKSTKIDPNDMEENWKLKKGCGRASYGVMVIDYFNI